MHCIWSAVTPQSLWCLVVCSNSLKSSILNSIACVTAHSQSLRFGGSVKLVKKDLRSRSLFSCRFLFFHCRYAASDASLREEGCDDESVPPPSPSVVVCDDTSDELDDSEFRDVFRCKIDLVRGAMPHDLGISHHHQSSFSSIINNIFHH